ncbi:MAG: DNA-binding domain-containing protein [Gammaproteobacteria bacterium]|nr:DNA-binding domain-containing protein [Gammaproteobacteria bacterium]
MNWVRAGLRDGSVAVNAAGAWLHNIAGEAYVVTPVCFEAFAAGHELAPGTVRNRVDRLGRHRRRTSPSGAATVRSAAATSPCGSARWCCLC